MSCLFNSLCHYTRFNAAQLRSMICDHLQKNSVMIPGGVPAEDAVQWESDLDLERYVQRMRRSSEWGGSIEINAFCNMFHTRVIVHFNGKEIEHLPLKESFKHTLHIHYTGSHYTPLRVT